jgi:hypothetical protein
MLWKNRQKRYSLAETENMEKSRHMGIGVKGYLLSVEGGCHTHTHTHTRARARFGKVQ